MVPNIGRAERFRRLAEAIASGRVEFISSRGHTDKDDYRACEELMHHPRGDLYFDDRLGSQREHRVMVCLMFAAICENP